MIKYILSFVLLGSVCFLGASGCSYYRSFRAYYNTFYNAKQSFKKAEEERLNSCGELPSSALGLYDEAIKKASKVLTLYPESDIVDDSLLLLGKAFYHKGEYLKALEKFKELKTNFPQSKFRGEAQYWQGLCLWELKDYRKAKKTLQKVAEKKGKFSDDALIKIAVILGEEGLYQEALAKLKGTLPRLSNDKLKAKVYNLMGEFQAAKGDYKEALSSFRKAAKESSVAELEFKSKLGIGKSLEELGKAKEALKIYKSLLENQKFKDKIPELTLRIADCQNSLGDTKEALERYKKIAEQNQGSKYAAGAFYKMGEIYLIKLDSLDVAENFFKKAKEEAFIPKLQRKVAKRIQSIKKLKEYKSAKGTSPDTTFLLGELYLFEFSQPEKAIEEYKRIVENFPESELAPKAAYVIGWVQENVFKDLVKAEESFKRIIEDYPKSKYAKKARKELGLEKASKKLFLQAEELRLSGAQTEAYLKKLKKLIEEYPESSYAPKALYVIAWTYEEVKLDSTQAYLNYTKLAKEYPDTEYGKIAKEKLRGNDIPE